MNVAIVEQDLKFCCCSLTEQKAEQEVLLHEHHLFRDLAGSGMAPDWLTWALLLLYPAL